MNQNENQINQTEQQIPEQTFIMSLRSELRQLREKMRTLTSRMDEIYEKLECIDETESEILTRIDIMNNWEYIDMSYNKLFKKKRCGYGTQ